MMSAQSTLALCCYNPATSCLSPPECECHDEIDQDSIDISCSNLRKSRKLRNSGSIVASNPVRVHFGSWGARSYGKIYVAYLHLVCFFVSDNIPKRDMALFLVI